MKRIVTAYAEVPAPESEDARRVAAMLGVERIDPTGGILIGFAAGKAQAKLPVGARVVRVAVVVEVEDV